MPGKILPLPPSLSDHRANRNYAPCVKYGWGHWSVTSGQSFPHCQHWKCALWFMAIAFACRTRSCLQLHLVDSLTLAWSFSLQSLISALDIPDWCVWFCCLSAKNSSSNCLMRLFREIWRWFLYSSHLPLPLLALHTLAFWDCHSSPLFTSAQCNKGKRLTRQILLLMILLWQHSPWGGSQSKLRSICPDFSVTALVYVYLPM